ncbi:DUF4810 domain-containing protein [Neisseriaceae bacterium ESL0693]|nr:DUF4810 domain-containing protein [Neisseriaceae bacterium ESL0693]
MKTILLSIVAAYLLNACTSSSSPNTLYHWGKYQSIQHQAFDDSKPLPEQIQAMEEYFNQITSNQTHAAPGAHAHLGMLYTKLGRLGDAGTQFDLEKQLFPESGHYMDFLKNNMSKGQP